MFCYVVYYESVSRTVSFLSDCYVNVSRTVFCVLFICYVSVSRTVFSVLFVCYISDSPTVFFVFCLIVSDVVSRTVFSVFCLIVTLVSQAPFSLCSV